MKTEARRPTNKRMALLENAAEKVARTIALDRDIKVIVSGMMAAFNWKTKTLYLPHYSQEPDDPKLCAAHRGTLDHELSHVLFTDFDLAEKMMDQWDKEFGRDGGARCKFLWNCYEDPWIQVAYAKSYKGSKYHFAMMEEYVMEKTGGAQACDPTFIPPGGRSPIGTFGALSQAIVRTHPNFCGHIEVDEIPDASIRDLIKNLAPEIEQGRAAKSTQEALAAGEATWRKLLQLAEKPPQPKPEEQEEEGSGSEPGEEGEGPGKKKPGKDGKPKSDEKGEDEPGGDGETDREEDQSGSPGDQDDADEKSEGSEGGQSDRGEDEADREGDPEAGSPSTNDATADAGDEKGEGGEEEKDDRTAAQKAVEGDHTEMDVIKIVMGVEDEDGTPVGAHGTGEESAEITPETEAEHNPGGAGGGGPPEVKTEDVAKAIGGEWGEVQETNKVIANDFLHEIPPQYTIHPQSAARDQVVRYTKVQRDKGREKLELLEKTAGPAVKKLQSFLQGAFQASRQAMVIGGMEDGDDLDEGALPGIALGFRDPAIFTTTVRAVEESSFVTVLVDCSGSMGHSDPAYDHNGNPRIVTKSGYAAVTAMAIHKALAQMRVPHGVLGYTTTGGYPETHRSRGDGYLEWSRSSRALQMHEFVPAPGIHDDGAALPYITGMQWNLDGESVLWAAKYAAQHGGNYDRVILLVVADGLPAGADDARIEGAYLKEVVQKVAGAQIEVYGIGVCIEDFDIFRAYYPDSKGGNGKAPTGSMQIKAQEGLTDNVLRELTALLTRGYGMTRRAKR